MIRRGVWRGCRCIEAGRYGDSVSGLLAGPAFSRCPCRRWFDADIAVVLLTISRYDFFIPTGQLGSYHACCERTAGATSTKRIMRGRVRCPNRSMVKGTALNPGVMWCHGVSGVLHWKRWTRMWMLVLLVRGLTPGLVGAGVGESRVIHIAFDMRNA